MKYADGKVHHFEGKRAPELAARLAKGIFAKPGVYSAVVRFANADANINSDFKPDVRSLSFAVDLAPDNMAGDGSSRQDFSMQNATTLPINDSPAFIATIKVLTASNPVAVLVNMRKVTRPGGMLGVVVWGPPAQCESGVLFAELGPLMPPAPQDAPKAVAWSEEGELERLASAAGWR